VSDTTKSANQFRFQKRFNLITGKNNSIGKSSLVKNIFWALGCEPELDETWKQLDCKVLLDFSIESKDYSVLRTNNGIYFSEGNKEFHRFSNITGDYSKTFSAIVNFKALLPNRANEPSLKIPPPAYYFIPFYIDQLKSWASPWSSFLKLEQYSNWKQTIVKYHTGYLPAKHFEIQEEIFKYDIKKKDANEELERINTALDIVEKYIPKTNITITTEEFNLRTKEVKQDLGHLAREQEDLFAKLSDVSALKYHLSNQLEIAKRAVYEIEKDYQFSVENIENDDLECPLCGTSHDNSLVSRASILSDKQQAEDQVHFIDSEIINLSKIIDESQSQLEKIQSKIKDINAKYSRPEKNPVGRNLTELVDSFASQSVQRNVEETKVEKQALYKSVDDVQKDLKKEQKKLLSKKEKQELSNLFVALLTEFIEKLNAKGINLSKVKNPTDYNKLFGSGGAAEGTRAVLAYQLAIFKLIHYSENEIIAPFVIDTPNQQEQADKNYERIINLVVDNIPTDTQVILCAMENPYLEPYRKEASIIVLDENKLLKKDEYEKLSNEVSKIIQSAKK
jgi:archaellum component FlaC